MAELKKVKLALKYAIRKSRESFFLNDREDWEIFDGLVGILLSVVEDFGFSKEETTALYEEIKKEVEEEHKID